MGTRARAAVCLVAGGIGVLGGLLLAALAAGTAKGLPFDLPLMGSALFGNPHLDLWFLTRSASSPVFIATGLVAVGVGAHLLRAGLQHRPQAADMLPRPDRWRPYGRIGLAVFNAAIAAFVFAGGIASGAKWAPGGLLTGVGLTLGVVSWAVPYLASLRRVRWPKARCETVDGERGIVVARSPRTLCVLGAFSLVLALAGAIGLFEGLDEVRGWGLLGSEHTLMSLVFGVLFLGLAVVLGIGTLYRAVHRDRLALTPTRLVHRTRRSSFAVEWDEIHVPFAIDTQGNPQLLVAVSPECTITGAANKRVNRQLAGADQLNGELEFGLFAIDPITLYHALIWYWFYPETRAELATHAAAERVRDADLRSGLTAELDRPDEELLEELEREVQDGEVADDVEQADEAAGETGEQEGQADDPEIDDPEIDDGEAGDGEAGDGTAGERVQDDDVQDRSDEHDRADEREVKADPSQ